VSKKSLSQPDVYKVHIGNMWLKLEPFQGVPRYYFAFAVLFLYRRTVVYGCESADSAAILKEKLMQFEAAVLNAEGTTFAVVIVKPDVISNPLDANSIIAAIEKVLDGKPVVLMAQDSVGTPKYFGRGDITGFMESVPVDSIPWQRFTLH